MRYLWTLRLLLLLVSALGCSGEDGTQAAHQGEPDASVGDTGTGAMPTDGAVSTSDGGSVDESDASMPPADGQSIFTHKMIKNTGESPFASLAYECRECTFEQWASIDPPEGWTKGPAQVAVFSEQHSTMRSYPSVEGHPDAVDFLDDVPGNEYKVIAITLNGRLVGRGSDGIVAEVKVQRDTRLVFTAGMRVHELTDPEGNVFVLFVHHVDSGDWQDADFQSADALSYFAAPDGWTYATRILEEELALDSDNSEGVVTVLAIRGAINSTWERR